ncbi:MAG: hypothetical protein ACOYN6_08020 [Ignavibacteria bacterium]
MNKEDVYKYYGWNPSDGDYKPPSSEDNDSHHNFSFYALKFYHQILRVITLKFF